MPFSIRNMSEITEMDLDELFKVVHEMENTNPTHTHTESKNVNRFPDLPSAEDIDYFDKFIKSVQIPHDWTITDDRPKHNDFPFDVNYNPHDYNYNHKDYGYNTPDLTYDTSNDHHKEHPGIGMIFGFLGVILCGTLIFLAVYLIHRCYKNNEGVTTASNTTRPNNSPAQRINLCVDTNVNSDRPLLSVITHNPNHLDLPPAYADTNNSATVCPHGLNNPSNVSQTSNSKNSKYTAPPTYEEALANTVASAPVCEICTSPSAPPDYQYNVDSSTNNRS